MEIQNGNHVEGKKLLGLHRQEGDKTRGDNNCCFGCLQEERELCIELDGSKFVKLPIVHYVKESTTKGIWDAL